MWFKKFFTLFLLHDGCCFYGVLGLIFDLGPFICVFLRFKFMESFGELPTRVMFPIDLPLETKCYVFISSFVIHVSTSTLIKNSIITNPSDQWVLLAKQRDHWKAKSCVIAILTLYALMASFSPTVNSSSNTTSKELLIKFVLYYLFVSFIGQKKGVITYKSINGMSSLQKHLKTNHQQL